MSCKKIDNEHSFVQYIQIDKYENLFKNVEGCAKEGNACASKVYVAFVMLWLSQVTRHKIK